jgi:hypothetical protein
MHGSDAQEIYGLSRPNSEVVRHRSPVPIVFEFKPSE